MARGAGDGVINGLWIARAFNTKGGAKRFTSLRSLSVDASISNPAYVVLLVESMAESMSSPMYCTALSLDCAVCAPKAQRGSSRASTILSQLHPH